MKVSCALQPLQIFILSKSLDKWVFLTLFNSSTRVIDYHSVEKYPLTIDNLKQFKLTLEPSLQSSYEKIIQAEWDKKINISPSFYLTKHHECVHLFKSHSNFDVIFFDAFSPRKQPELWKESVLMKMYSLLNDTGIFVTYCAKGEVKRTLKKIGFKCETLTGPPGKKEMVRALKSL